MTQQTFRDYLDFANLMEDPDLERRLEEGVLSKIAGAAKMAMMSTDDKIKHFAKLLMDPKTPLDQAREMKAFLAVAKKKGNLLAKDALTKREKLEASQKNAMAKGQAKADEKPFDWKGQDTERRGQ